MKLLQNHLTIVANVLSNVFGGAIKYITGQIALVKDTFMNIIDFVKNVFTGNWEGAWENVKNVFFYAFMQKKRCTFVHLFDMT